MGVRLQLLEEEPRIVLVEGVAAAGGLVGGVVAGVGRVVPLGLDVALCAVTDGDGEGCDKHLVVDEREDVLVVELLVVGEGFQDARQHLLALFPVFPSIVVPVHLPISSCALRDDQVFHQKTNRRSRTDCGRGVSLVVFVLCSEMQRKHIGKL